MYYIKTIIFIIAHNGTILTKKNPDMEKIANEENEKQYLYPRVIILEITRGFMMTHL